jgi:hypothetical protein
MNQAGSGPKVCFVALSFLAYFSTLKMEVTCSFETSVDHRRCSSLQHIILYIQIILIEYCSFEQDQAWTLRIQLDCYEPGTPGTYGLEEVLGTWTACDVCQ